MTDIATLGFAVDTSGLDKANASLDDLSEKGNEAAASAKKVGDSFSEIGTKASSAVAPATNSFKQLASEMFNGKAATSAYSAEVSKLYGINGQLSNSEASVIKALQEKNVAMQLGAQGVATYTALQKAGTAATSEAGMVISSLVAAQYAGSQATSSWRNAWGLFTPSVNESSNALRGHSAATTEAQHAIRGVVPVLNEAGVGIAGLTQFTYAARSGMTALAVALIGTVVVALAKAGDEAITTTKRLGDLLGSGAAGKSAFAGLDDDAKKLGVSVSTLSGPMETVLQLMQNQNRIAGVIYAPGSESANAFAGDVNKARTALLSLGEQLKPDIASTADLNKAFTEIFKSVQTSGGLTAQTFQRIIDLSPATANAIAKTYKGQDAETFLATLQKMPLSTQRFLDLLVQMKPAADAAFAASKDGVQTVSSEIDKVVQSAERLWKAMSDDPGVKAGLKAIADGLDYLSDHADLAKGAMILLAGAIAFAFGGWVVAGIVVIGATLVTFAGQVKSVIEWVQGLIDKWNEWLTVGSKQPNAKGNLAADEAKGAVGGAIAGAAVGFMTPIPGGLIGGAVAGGLLGAGLGAGIGLGSLGLGESSPGALGGGPAPSSGSTTGGAIDPIANANVTGGVPELFATGTAGIRTVPKGFPNDSYQISLTSGEQFAVAPAGQDLRALIANSPIKVGMAGTDRNFAGGTGDDGIPNVDAAITTSGQLLNGLIDHMGDYLSKLGIGQTSARETVSAAGNNKLNDVIRLGTIQTISAIKISSDTITGAITSGDSAIVGAISAGMAAIQSSVTASASAASSGSSGGATSGVPSASGGVNFSDTTGRVYQMKGLQSGNMYAGTAGISAAGATQLNSGDKAATAQAAADTAYYNANYKGAGPVNSSGYLGSGSSGSQGGAGPKTDPNYKPPDAKATSTLGLPDDMFGTNPAGDVVKGAVGPYTDASASQDNPGLADGGTLLPPTGVIPGGHPNDTFQAKVRLSTGERFRVEKNDGSKGGGNGGQGGGHVTQYNSITVHATDLGSFKRSEAQIGEQQRRMSAKALLHT